MKATTSVLALVAVAGAQAASMHKRHHGHHRRGDYATPSGSDYAAPSSDSSAEDGLCKEVVTGKWVELKRDVEPLAVHTYQPPAPCTVPAPVITACNEPGIYVFPEQNVHLDAPVNVGDQHYDAGSYCQPSTTYTITTPTTVTCTFGYTPPTKAAEPAPVEPAPVEPAPVEPAPVEPAAVEPAKPYGGEEPKKPKKPHGRPGGGQGPQGGKQWAVTYSPYQNGGGCRSAGDIARDIGQIASKGFRAVRVYSTDCGTLEAVGPACRKNGIKMIVGAFIKNDGMANANKDVDALCQWGKAGNWDLVDMIVLGNEAVQGGQCSYEALVGFIDAGKGKLKSPQCGCPQGIPVTTAETLNVYEQHGDLCGHLDVAGFNCHPFFNKDNTPDKSGQFLIDELNILSKICGGMKAYSLETGWPNGGTNFGRAVPGPGQQAEAFKSIYQAEQGNIAYFTWTNDGWKDPGQYGVETRFGCGDVFRQGGGL